MYVQLWGALRSNAINPPKTARMATRGIIAFMPSAAPLLELSTLSVSQALKAASFADEPKKVIRQSRIITREIPTDAAEATIGNTAEMTSSLMRINASMEMPQRIYPPHIKSLRFPILSESAPMNTVVRVAATALAATIAEMSAADALNIL